MTKTFHSLVRCLMVVWVAAILLQYGTHYQNKLLSFVYHVMSKRNAYYNEKIFMLLKYTEPKNYPMSEISE
jgi:hypothetical protein